VRYEKLMSLLKSADSKPTLTVVGDWIHDENGKRGPLLQTVQDGIAEGHVEVDPANRLHLTEMGHRRLHKVGGNVRLTVAIPKEREAEFKKMLLDFFRG
jgi:hypothetical protein